VTPAPAGPPPDPAAASSFGGWLKQNGTQLVVIAAVLVAVLRYLHPLDVLLIGFGLSLIIFIHELGHFLAAKWCDVHVKTFSIGFGPALPFCSYKYGETTYKLALIPLGGYVAMVGEGDKDGDVVEAEEDPEAAKADPRSFANKPVGQRMLIISAGVIMNVLLGAVCFAVTYLHGVEEQPAVCWHVEPGSAAWRAGLHSGTEIKVLNGRADPWFDDIRPVVSSTPRGGTVHLVVEYAGTTRTLDVPPLRVEGALFPQLGVLAPLQPTLRAARREKVPPYTPQSAAARATAGEFRPGDKIVAMTDPADPARVTPLDPRWNGLPGEFYDYHRRLTDLAGKPVTFQVVRKDDPGSPPVTVTVPPAYRQDVGLRMRMGPVLAVRAESPAAAAGVQPRQTDGEKVVAAGDRIIGVTVVEPDGNRTLFTADKETAAAGGTTVNPLDPLRLPFELDAWALRAGADRKPVTLTVLREVDRTDKRVDLTLTWDPAWRYDNSTVSNPGTPLPVNGLGLAYAVQSVVDAVAPGSPAAAAGLQPNDRVTDVKFAVVDFAGQETVGKDWEPVQPLQWAFVDTKLQLQAPHKLWVRVDRGGQPVEAELAAVEDKSWGSADVGLALTPDTRTQKADGLWDALRMGANRTARKANDIYLGLYSLVTGVTSVKMMSGPITLARVGYLIAGHDEWHLLLFLGLISINLAIVNFLPIPVLDGGHMLFLVYEWLRGKPAPASVQVVLTYLGLAVILCLMLFVIGLDVWRLFFA
jgi:regulator of sigma E protease